MAVIDITIPSLASKKFDANVHAKIRTTATAIATGMLTPNLTPSPQCGHFLVAELLFISLENILTFFEQCGHFMLFALREYFTNHSS